MKTFPNTWNYNKLIPQTSCYLHTLIKSAPIAICYRYICDSTIIGKHINEALENNDLLNLHETYILADALYDVFNNPSDIYIAPTTKTATERTISPIAISTTPLVLTIYSSFSPMYHPYFIITKTDVREREQTTYTIDWKPKTFMDRHWGCRAVQF